MVLEPEYREGYLIPTEMKKVWQIQLSMLNKLLSVCQHYNLQIWADGGTLLGAVRHHGYIPWDDDIDMIMMRKDYEILKTVAAHEFKEPFFFQCAQTDKYVRGHAQLRYNGTTAALIEEIGCPFNQSIFIDIFVMDNLPSDPVELRKLLSKARIMQKVMVWGIMPLSAKHISRSIVQIGCKLLFALYPLNKFFAKYENLFLTIKSPRSNEVAPIMYAAVTAKRHIRQEWYNDTMWIPFEDIELPVPKDYHRILSTYYGADYMTPRHVSTSHGQVIFDPGKSYTEVIKEIKNHTYRPKS